LSIIHYNIQIYRKFEVFQLKYFRKLIFKQYCYPKRLNKYFSATAPGVFQRYR